MLNIFKLSLFGAAALYAAPALAQSTNEATTTAQTTIVQPVSIAVNSPLQFGTIVKSGAGSVTLDNTATAVQVTGGLAAVGTASHASFTITGGAGQTVSITGLPADNKMTMTSSDGSIDLTLTPSITTGTVVLAGDAGTTATQDLTIGGTFDVTSDTKIGAYSGDIAVTVNYS